MGLLVPAHSAQRQGLCWRHGRSRQKSPHKGITLLFGRPGLEACEGRVSRRLPGAGAYRVRAGEHDTGSFATVPTVTIAVPHASRAWDAERAPAAAKAGRWPGEAAWALLRERC
jgi:hypothetical protein